MSKCNKSRKVKLQSFYEAKFYFNYTVNLLFSVQLDQTIIDIV